MTSPNFLFRGSVNVGTWRSISISSDNELIAAAGKSPGLVLFRRDGDALDVAKEIKTEQHCCAFSPDGRYLAFGGKTVKVLDTQNKFKVVGSLPLSKKEQVTAIAWSPDGTTLAAAELSSRSRGSRNPNGFRVVFWSPFDGSKSQFTDKDIVGETYAPFRIVESLCFLPDGHRVSIAGRAHIGWWIYDRRDGSVVFPEGWEAGHASDLGNTRVDAIWGRVPGPDRLSVDSMSVVARWGKKLETFATPSAWWLRGVQPHPAGGVGLSLSARETHEGDEGPVYDQAIFWMDPDTGETERLTHGEERQAFPTFAFSPDGSLMVVASYYGGGAIYQAS